MVESTTWCPDTAVDVTTVLAPLVRGTGDPAYVEHDGVVWRTCRTPEGPATLRLQPRAGAVHATAWGEGAAWALRAVPDLLGARDDPDGFAPEHPVLREAWRRHRDLRLLRTGLVLEALVPAVLEQKVTGGEARRSWRELLSRFGTPAPGPAPGRMRVFPPAAVWRRIPSWEWHRAGVDGKRARTILAAAAVAGRLEETTVLPREQALRRLRAVPGVGAWTAAEVAQRAYGDPDAVSVGDYHLPKAVGWALAGRPVDDAGMLDLLAPYAPHRQRAVRLLGLTGVRAPSFGPRMPHRDIRGL